MNRVGLAVIVLVAFATAGRAEAAGVPIGVAQVDITPGEPVRLSGYGNRRVPADGIEQKLRAKALAIGDEKTGGPAVLITVDNLGVPATMTAEVGRRLGEKAGLAPERLAVAASHTHTAPCLTGVAPLLFGEPIPPDHQAAIDRYTAFLTDKLTEVALAALADRKPGSLAWGEGEVGFAANRRLLKDGTWAGFGVNPNGPVQHALPVLAVKAPDGALRAVVVNYACHCTTLGGDYNRVCGDWSGYAQEAIERDHPGVVALVAVGCGADANPEPRGQLGMARQHGEALATEAKRLLASELVSLPVPIECKLTRIDLPFAEPPSREEFAKRAQKPGAEGLHARTQIARLDAGQVLPRSIPYPVQTWRFGDALAMVFLAGEVVVDYDLRLRYELAARKLWITAYANDDPCYIASKRLMPEGGYEVDGSMLFYDRPGRLAPEAEDRIIRAVHDQLPDSFDPTRP